METINDELLREAEWRERVLEKIRMIVRALESEKQRDNNERAHIQAMERFVFPLRNPQ